MIKLYDTGVYLLNGREIVKDNPNAPAYLASKGKAVSKEDAKRGTMAFSIIRDHNTGSDSELRIKFDSLTTHDITYVGIIQTARASGMERFPMPVAMTNCHNSLCAVGGTINEDDHMFALSAAKKYGGIYVPPNLAVIHSYNREMMAKCGGMILGSDSHTRYGALGTMAVGEGGGELAKQLVGRTYDLKSPGVIAVYLTGKPRRGVGPMDVALTIVGNVYKNGYAKNKVMEFVGDGIADLPVEYRNGIDVMTTETTCWSSIWETDSKVKDYFEIHGRPQAYKELKPKDVAYYDGLVYIDLSKIKPTIAMPFHPSNIYTIEELKANAAGILAKVEKDCLEQLDNKAVSMGLSKKLVGGDIYVDQGVVAGCAGGTFRERHLQTERLPRQPARLHGACAKRLGRKDDGGGRDRPLLLLRALLRRGGHPGKRRALDQAHDPELPQPGGFEAGRGADCGGRPDGRPFDSRHRDKRRQTDGRDRDRGRIQASQLLFR